LKPPLPQGRNPHDVAPHAGAWIETVGILSGLQRPESPPTRGRGLKPIADHIALGDQVAPHAGAWIETSGPSFAAKSIRRPPRGGVD